MRYLMLVNPDLDRRMLIKPFYRALGDALGDLTILRPEYHDQVDLRRYFAASDIDLSDYERVILFTRFKWWMRQTSWMQTLSQPVFLEQDACQNYARDSKLRGKFSRTYKQVPWARVLASGHGVARRLRAEGFDAHFASSKGWDPGTLRCLDGLRDIDCGFVGAHHFRSGRYERAKMLARLKSVIGVQIMRTEPGADYCAMLNRIRFFISADVGSGEFMIKNFEAMACGCVLCAYDQGAEEAEALGFEDMVNVVFYREPDELAGKLKRLRADPELADRIAAAGRQLAQRYTYDALVPRIVDSLRAPMRQRLMRRRWLLFNTPGWRPATS